MVKERKDPRDRIDCGMTIALSRQQREMIRLIAYQKGCTQSKTVREAINFWLKEHEFIKDTRKEKEKPPTEG